MNMMWFMMMHYLRLNSKLKNIKSIRNIMDPTNLKRNHLISYRESLKQDECDEIIKLIHTKVDQVKDGTDSSQDITFNDTEHRQDWNIFAQNYGSLDAITQLIRDRVNGGWTHYLQCYLEGYDPTNNKRSGHMEESVKLQWSPPDGGFTGWHSEQGSSAASMPRYAVWMIYLNSIPIEDGGGTQFRHLTDKHGELLEIQPEAGTLLIWPASYTHEHRSAPNLKADKYIATGWFTYDPGRDFRKSPKNTEKT
jgi:hypothetical protein